MLGLGLDRLRAEMNRLLASLFHQGVLDEHFLQLRQLEEEEEEEEGCPNFVSDVLNIYFHDSDRRLRHLRELLMSKELVTSADYKKMGMHLNQLVGSSSSIGAKRVTNVCIAFRAASNRNNRPRCLRALQVLEEEHSYLTNKLHEFLHLEQQHLLAVGITYPIQH